jgi:hypothetical protein
MALNGFIPHDPDAPAEASEIPILVENVAVTNFWFEEGRCIIPELTRDDLIYILARTPQARIDYIKAVNPKRLDYVELINTPMVEPFEDTRDAGQIYNAKESVDFLWNQCKGIPPGWY